MLHDLSGPRKSLRSRGLSGPRILAGRGGGALTVLTFLILVAGSVGLRAAEIELKRVMLSSGGVGYFEYQADVEGEAELELNVRLDQVDDVLKSIVIYDDKGGVGSFRLQSQASLEEIYRDLPFGPEALSSLDRMLAAMKGNEIEVSGPRPLTGRIASVEAETEVTRDGATRTRHRVGLITQSGLQHFILEDTKAVRFADDRLDARITRALERTAAQSGGDSRTLLIRSKGSEARRLTIGYVVAAPLWKASYRLVLPREDFTRPFAAQANGDAETVRARLQGWAVVDNASGQDWDGIELTLTSGNPVTFRQALYATYYVDRPQVPLEVMGQILPAADEGGIERDADEMAEMEAGKRARDRREMRGMTGGRMAAAPVPAAEPGGVAQGLMVTSQSAEPMAQSTEAFSHIEFAFKESISVENGQSLVVPIIDRPVPSERIHVFDPRQLASVGIDHRPFAAVRLTNDSETSLPPGALTLYEQTETGTVFVGDARMKTLPKGDNRFVSYALDEKTFVDESYSDQPDKITLARLSNGVLERETVNHFAYEYLLKAPEEERRRLMLVIPEQGAEFDNAENFKYVKSNDAHRIQIDLDPAEERQVKLNFLRRTSYSTSFFNLDLKTMALLFDNVELDPSMQSTINEIKTLKREIEQAETRIRTAEREVTAIHREQKRIRENISSLDRSSALYQRYLTKLDSQENELENRQDTIRTQTSAKDEAEKNLRTLIDGLSFEIRNGRLSAAVGAENEPDNADENQPDPAPERTE